MKDLEDWASVQKVYKQTQSKRATASILGISTNTVKRLLSMTEAPIYHRTKYSSKIDPYKEQIIEWRCEPYDFNGTRIFRELKKLRYAGSISPVYRFLRRIDEEVGGHISSKAAVRHESPPLGIRHSSIGQNIRCRLVENTEQFWVIRACHREKIMNFCSHG